MSNSNTKQLLVCQIAGCNEEFIDEVNENLDGDAASLPSALKAHKAGWLLIEGKILCPQCAKQIKNPLTH